MTYITPIKWLCYSTVLLLCNPTVAATNTVHNNDIATEYTHYITPVKPYHSRQSMVVTAHPLATNAAFEILNKGGNAIDAAITAQLVLGLVEPQSSGLGGGGFMLYWSAKAKQLQYFDGRETSPSSVDENHFLNDKHQPLKFFDALIGGHAVGTPGLVSLLDQVHQQHGQLPWAELFKPAIKLAKQGFAISPRLHASLLHTPKITTHAAIKSYFFNSDGQPKAEGSLLKNPAYAETLERIAQQGRQAFYEGKISRDIVNAVQHDPIKPGKLALRDFQQYRSIERKPLCSDYLVYTICTAAPPSSGVTVLQILNLLANTQAHKLAIDDPASIHLFAEASKLAFADRDSYIADPDFVDVPTQALLNKDYIHQRSQLINPARSMGVAKAGNVATPARHANSPEFPSTTHFSIIDKDGNAVSMTSSIEMGFGSRIMVDGFLLNNQLTDFSFSPRDEQQNLIANRMQAGKRPRSSMSPTIVFKDQQPIMLIGSPGGSFIIDYVAQTLFYTLNGKLDLNAAIASPHIVHLNRQLEVEQNRFSSATIEALRQRGHTVRERDLNSGLHGIWISPSTISAGIDPRREGTAKGN